MSFPSTLGSQVAAIMDVLAQAAVAEVTKLLEDGAVVLRLEMRRRDTEIQELRRSLKLTQVELLEARGAAMTRATGVEQGQTSDEPQVQSKDERDDEQRGAGSLEPAESLYKHRHGTEGGEHMGPALKHEPADELAIQETTDDTAAAAAALASANVCFEVGERDDPIWPLPAACSMFDKSTVAVQQQQQQQQQHMQMFPPLAEQFPAHRNSESSYNSMSTATEETEDDSLSVAIKVEAGVRPLCMGSATSESARNEPLTRVSRPAVGENRCSQSTSQRARPSPAAPHAQRSAADAEHILGRNHLRAKRQTNVWRANHQRHKGFGRLSQLEEHRAAHQPFKPFRCLECGKSFTQKSRLKTHQSVHTGERPFSCKICGKMFSRQDNCLRHERFHSGLKPYGCGQCGKSFTVLGNLRIHQEIHLQGR